MAVAFFFSDRYTVGMRIDSYSVKHGNLLEGRVMGYRTRSQTSSHYLLSRQNMEVTAKIGPRKLYGEI